MQALILDDELTSVESLFLLLQRYCPDIKVVALETSMADALEKARSLQPPLLFLDVDLQTSSGFDLLPKLHYSFGVIFTTAYEQYAFRAFQTDAIDYLLKPIDPEALIKAVQKAKMRLPMKANDRGASLPEFLLKRISVPVAEGLVFLNLAGVIRFEAQGSYTLVVREVDSDLLLSKNLQALENMTRQGGFIRVHRSHLVNKSHIVKYFKGEGGELQLSNGHRIPVARNRRDNFLDNVG